MMLSSSTRNRILVLAAGTALISSSQLVACGGDSNNTGGSTSSSSSAGGGNGGTGLTSTEGGGGTGGTAGGGGTGGSGVGGFDAPDKKWTFIPVDGAKCMNGTATGIGVNLNSASNDVIIYLEGGNACFNAYSCHIVFHPDGYGASDLAAEEKTYLTAPMFDRSSSLFKDYNFVYVPYCTGDVHGGDNDTEVAGVMRHFHGANNMDLYLARMKAQFPNAKNVIISGSSAGGFGAAVNYDRTAKVFPKVDVGLIDDCGPPMAEAYASACLQADFMRVWGLAKTLPADCADCRPADGAFMEPLIKYVATKYPKGRLSLISGTQDGTISQFWGYGQKDGFENCCKIQQNSSDFSLPNGYGGFEYSEGLYDLRNRIIGITAPNFKSFLIDGTDGQDNTNHVWLDQNHNPTTVMSNGVTLEKFLEDQVGGAADWDNVGLPDDPGYVAPTGQGGAGGAAAECIGAGGGG